jgi:predicted transcriptional regulator
MVSIAQNTGMKPSKSMTLRLSADQAEALETVATIDNQSIAEVIRAAIAEHVEKRRQDRAFQDGLKERIDRAKRMLGR